MWEDSLGKVKTKRNIKCVKPYERPKVSFVVCMFLFVFSDLLTLLCLSGEKKTSPFYGV